MGRRYPAGLSLTQICNCFVIAWEAAGEDYEAVLSEARVEENTLYRVTASGVPVVLLRQGKQFRALSATGPHAGGPLLARSILPVFLPG